MDIKFWNNRYKEQGYAYGLEPNDFLKSRIDELKPQSEVLFLAEGEGRNAIFLDEHKHKVTAIDYSIEGLNKLSDLARERHLQIKTICADLTDYKIEPHKWDAIISILAIFQQVYVNPFLPRYMGD